MAAASDLDDGGISTPQAEEVPPPEQHNAAAPVPWPAAVAERYERREKLGQGLFGDVYKAWDRVDKRLVAVKSLAWGTGGDAFAQTGMPDFVRQATCLSACRGHPSIVELLATYAADNGRGDGDGFIVTEYAGPMNLREYMDVRRRSGPPFNEDEVREIMGQLLAGAKHAHGAGVLHRAVVPENVVVSQDDEGGRVYKICGFGMAEPAAQAGKDDYGLLASPSPYRAPELFLGSKDYDGRVDTWALGCVMAELIAGTDGPFFGGRVDEEVLAKMMYVVGMERFVEWRGLERVAPRDRAASLRKAGRRERSHLREVFPRKYLSPAGFEVLKGLLHGNPDRRLTAAAALGKPWFRPRCFGGCFMPRGGGVAPKPIARITSIFAV